MRRLVVLLFALACWWPTRELPWSRIDSPNFVLIAEALARLPLAQQIPAAVNVEPVLGPIYAGVLNPVIWFAYEACALTIGFDVRLHRILRLGVFVLLGWWVLGVTRRTARSRDAALCAALGFLAFPSHLECLTLLPMYEPIQVLNLAACLLALWIWTLPGRRAGWLVASGACAALAVWSKSTSWCLVAPVGALTVWAALAVPAGPERRRLASGLATLWVALVLLLVVYTKTGGGQRKPGAWVSSYRVEAGVMRDVLRYDVDELWRATALLVPLAAVGLVLRPPRWRSRRGLLVLVCAGWAAGAFLIFLPWSAPSSRYWLLGSAPFAVLTGTGLHALWRSRRVVPRAAIVACVVWMAFVFAVRRDALVSLEGARDGSVDLVVRALARDARPGATIRHACGPDPTRCDLFTNVGAHLVTFARRADLAFSCRGLGSESAGPGWLVVTPREDTAASPRAPDLELYTRPEHREAPDPRYFLHCLRTGKPLVQPGWHETWRWRIYRP